MHHAFADPTTEKPVITDQKNAKLAPEKGTNESCVKLGADWCVPRVSKGVFARNFVLSPVTKRPVGREHMRDRYAAILGGGPIARLVDIWKFPLSHLHPPPEGGGTLVIFYVWSHHPPPPLHALRIHVWRFWVFLLSRSFSSRLPEAEMFYAIVYISPGVDECSEFLPGFVIRPALSQGTHSGVELLCWRWC